MSDGPIVFTVMILALLSFHAWLEWSINRKYGDIEWFAVLFGFVGLIISILARISRLLSEQRKPPQQF